MVASELYPFRSHYLNRNGIRLHYLDEGRGQAVVMVHGNPTWSFYYRDLVRALREGFRVVVPDHVGCGYSDKPGDDSYEYTLKSRVDDLEALLDHLGLVANLTLVVHDWGGMIGLAFAARYPDRIARLVIMNTAAFPLPAGKRLPWGLRLARDTTLGAFLVRGFNAFCRSAAKVCCKRRPLPAAVRAAYLEPYDSWANRIAVLRFVQDIPLGPGDPAYSLVAQTAERLPFFAEKPILICWGMRDFVFTPSFLRTWQEYFPRAETHRFEDAGHYVLEDAAEEITSLVGQFLRAHATGTGG